MKKKGMNYVNSMKGITLVALVITVIVLLILAGITINIALGENGLLKRTEEAKRITNNAQNEEVAMLEQADKYIEGQGVIILPPNTEETEAGTYVRMPNNWYTETPIYASATNGTEVKNSIKVASVDAVSDGKANTIPVPKGFYYVGGNIESGFVISDDARDKDKYKGIEDVPAGAIYNEDGTVKEYTDEEYNNLTAEQKKAVLMGNQFIWIPCSKANYKKENFGKTNNTGWDTSTNTAEKVQIEKYGGFYVGRYEAGTSKIKLENGVQFENISTASSWQNGNFVSSKVTEGKITCKAGEIPYYHADIQQH